MFTLFCSIQWFNFVCGGGFLNPRRGIPTKQPDMLPSILLRVVIAAALAIKMSHRGLKHKSLSRSGAAAAFCVGLVHMSCSYTFGIVLIAFYMTSSKLTKLNQDRKAAYDASVQLGGQRGLRQVFSNSAGGCLAAVVAFVCSVQRSSRESSTAELIELLAWVAFLGHYSCCCADTWASELGMLSSSPPRLITSGRQVPAGTNGGVTLLGLSAGASGGLLMGFIMWAAGYVTQEIRPLDSMLTELLQQQGSPQLLLQYSLPFWLVLGTAAGMFGSVVDSLLGATVQYSGWCQKTLKVVARAGPHVHHLSGLPLLSNNAVNAVSALLTSAVAVAGVTYWAGAVSILGQA